MLPLSLLLTKSDHFFYTFCLYDNKPERERARESGSDSGSGRGRARVIARMIKIIESQLFQNLSNHFKLIIISKQ